MTGKIFLKLIAGVFCLLLLALVTVDYFATNVAKDNYIQNLTGQLADKGRMLALTFADAGRPECRPCAPHGAGGRRTDHRGARATARCWWIPRPTPPVWKTTARRPELMQAFRGGSGSDIRQSATIGVSFLYVAVPVAGGASAIRIAFPLSEINRQVSQIRGKILVSTALAFLPAILIAAMLARYISRRFATIMSHAGELARGNFRARLPDTDSSEFGQLAQTLNETAGNLQKTVAQLQHEHAELEKLERVRKDFVINVSHELRTPLASIQGYTETLIDGAHGRSGLQHALPRYHPAQCRAPGAPHRGPADALARGAEAAEIRIRNPLRQRADSRRLRDDAVRSRRRAGFELMRGARAGGYRVCCDSEAVSQILSNLMENAIKYTPAGGQISVGALSLGSMVEFFVRDTGIGIPEEDLPRLFERFYRVDKARSRELGGTGLGLSIVKHLVAAHNGTTRVESRVHEGSTFSFTLPVNQDTLAQDTLNPEFTAS